MRINFRPIRPEEIPAASLLVDAAYAPQVREIYGDNSRQGRWRHYDEAKIESYVAREPEGVRVGVWKEKLVSFNVCRSYGAFGWFHTLAVHPKFQGMGLGRQAVADAELYLAGRGVTSIALMTWPGAIKNLAFYQLLGYRLRGISVNAYRNVDKPVVTGASPFYAQLYASALPQDAQRVQQAVRALAQNIWLGLDYLPWVQWALHQSFAETLLLWRDGQLQALALYYFFSKSYLAEGKLLLLHPSLSHSDKLWVLEHIRLWAKSQQRDVFGLPVELTSTFAQQILLPHGFKFYPESMANMVKGDDPPDSAHHFVRFGG